MASTESASRSNKGAPFLFLLGLGLAGAGIAFAFAPHFSWKVTQIARQANELGLQNGVLFIGGLLAFGLSIVARTASEPPALPDTRGESEALQSEIRLLNDQLSTKLAQLRTSLMHIHQNVTDVNAQIQSQLQEDSQKATAGDHSREAVFRLAASLDKLHAHFDERVHAMDLQMRSGFESLLNASHEVHRTLGQGGVSGAHAHEGPTPSIQTHTSQATLVHPIEEISFPEMTPDEPPQAGIDFYGTMQKLDAIAGEDLSSGMTFEHSPEPPFPSQGQSQSQVDALDALLPEEYRDRY